MARWRCLECTTSGISGDGLQALADYYTHYELANHQPTKQTGDAA